MSGWRNASRRGAWNRRRIGGFAEDSRCRDGAQVAARAPDDFFNGLLGAAIGAAVSISLLGVVPCGTVCGSMLPFVLRRPGFGPASASAPFVATLVDVTGLVVYFSVSRALLAGTLL